MILTKIKQILGPNDILWMIIEIKTWIISYKFISLKNLKSSHETSKKKFYESQTSSQFAHLWCFRSPPGGSIGGLLDFLLLYHPS